MGELRIRPPFAEIGPPMIVPDHWAEARCQHRAPGKQITVRRFGWSMTSARDAEQMAAERASDALRRILAGQRLTRTERKQAYNGADGIPIREEVLARHGEDVIESLGSVRTDDSLRAVMELHDRESKALSPQLPIA